MKNIKKIAAVLISGVMLFSVSGCANLLNNAEPSQTEEAAETNQTTINIATLKGPTGIGMVKLMEDNANGTTANKYAIDIEADPSAIGPMLTSGEVDIAALPLNLAANLYNKTSGKVQLLAINTLGVLYVLEQGNSIISVADLKGKTIYATGQASTPEYILNYVLSSNGIDPQKDVTIEYLSDHSELATRAAAGNTAICMLPEPFVTTVLSKNPQMRIALNMTTEWVTACDKIGLNSTLAMGCIVVRKDFANKNAYAVNTFLREYNSSVDFVHNNVNDAAALTVKQSIIGNIETAQKAIPNCNIVFIAGSDMRIIAKQNLNVLFSANPSSIGGVEPDDDFYFGS